jgi:CBS domain-containing protein
MTSPVVTARSDTSFQELVELMLRHDISGVPIVGPGDFLVGIVTEADLVSKEAFGARRRPLDVAAAYAFRAENVWATKARAMIAGELMSAPVRTARPDDQLRYAAARMVTDGVKRLPVVDDDGRVVGIVSRCDVLAVFSRPDEEIVAEVAHVLADALVVPDDHDVHGDVRDGVVTLRGSVERARDVAVIDAALRDVAGVVDVIAADVKVRAPSP